MYCQEEQCSCHRRAVHATFPRLNSHISTPLQQITGLDHGNRTVVRGTAAGKAYVSVALASPALSVEPLQVNLCLLPRSEAFVSALFASYPQHEKEALYFLGCMLA